MDDVSYLAQAYQLVTLIRLPIARYSRTGDHENVTYEITYSIISNCHSTLT